MLLTQQSAFFRREKQQFFSQISVLNNAADKFNAADTRAAQADYNFFLNNQYLLEREVADLFQALKKQNKELSVFYLYFCASLSQVFYNAYGQSSKAQDMANIKEQIKNQLNNDKEHQYTEQSFNDYLYTAFRDSFNNLIHAPFHVAKIRDYVGYANICRIYWVFSRLTIVQGFRVAKELIEQFDILLGTHTDVDKIISRLQAPTGIINYFSVGFFLARIAIDGGLLIKHTFFPSDLERDAERGSDIHYLRLMPKSDKIEGYRNSYLFIRNELYYLPKKGSVITLNIADKSALKAKIAGLPRAYLSPQEINELITQETGHSPEKSTAFERFIYELKKRHCNFINDFIWATVNFLTNFNHLTGISGSAAGCITAVFLVFDVCMALYKNHLAKQEYLLKRSQYTAELKEYKHPNYMSCFSENEKLAHVQLVNQQIQELEINWQNKEATCYFVASAAALLTLGFTASMILSSAVLVVGCYFVCTVAVAMYLSTDAYSIYKEKQLYLERADLEQLPLLHKEYDLARNEFIFTFAKNALVPTLLITTFALCWPAAVLLTAAYVGYELLYAQQQHQVKQEINTLIAEETDTSSCMSLF